MSAPQARERRGWRTYAPRLMLGAFVAALAITVPLDEDARAYDWTDADCSHWEGTPQHAQCAQAHEHLAESDCNQWMKGEKEFVKCQHAHNIARVQECQRTGDAMRASARANGWDEIATVPCPLVNEHTGVEEGNLDTQSRSTRRTLLPQRNRALQRRASPASADQIDSTLPSRPAVMVGPASWSNIQPSRSDAAGTTTTPLTVSPMSPPAAMLIDNGDGTVTDNQTGLQWEKKDNVCPGIHCVDDTYTWSSVPSAAGTADTVFLPALNAGGGFAGHIDWRLPTAAELQTILLAPCPCGMSPCIDPVFGPTAASVYWPTTVPPDINPLRFVLLVDFSNGYVGPGPADNDAYARAVRTRAD